VFLQLKILQLRLFELLLFYQSLWSVFRFCQNFADGDSAASLMKRVDRVLRQKGHFAALCPSRWVLMILVSTIDK